MAEKDVERFLADPEFCDAALQGVSGRELSLRFSHARVSPRRMREIASIVRVVQRLGLLATRPQTSEDVAARSSFVPPSPLERGESFFDAADMQPPDAALKDAREVATLPSERICTLEQLLEQAQVNKDEWDVLRFWVNKWEVAAKDAENRFVVQPVFQVRALLERRTPPPDVLARIADMIADAQDAMPAAAPDYTKKPTTANEPVLVEPCLFDHHFGKLADREETGDAYNMEIAVANWQRCLNQFLDWALVYPGVEEVLFPIGNDLLHCDNTRHTTTRGTPQDVDGRFRLIYRRVRQLLCESIAAFAEIAPTRVVIVPGNHDELSLFTMGDALACWFRNHQGVFVDNRPLPRKYYRYGGNLFCFTHGNNEKLADLPLIMAREAATDWGRTCYHEIQVGHRHHTRQVDHKGVLVRMLGTLAGTDSYHATQGYIGSQKRAELLFFRQTGGILQQMTYFLPDNTSEPANAAERV